MSHFILVVDGEVAGELPVPRLKNADGNLLPAVEKLVAILSSNPQIILSEEPVQEGSLWNGTSFTSPV